MGRAWRDENYEFSRGITSIQNEISIFRNHIPTANPEETGRFCDQIEELLDLLRSKYESQVDKDAKQLAKEEVSNFQETFSRFLRDEILDKEPEESLREKLAYALETAIRMPKLRIEDLISNLLTFIRLPKDTEVFGELSYEFEEEEVESKPEGENIIIFKPAP